MAQVQVVSKGMKWSQEAAAKAKANHQYIKIGAKSGNLLLSGAPGRWKKPETVGDVYVPSLRVAGNPAVIQQVLVGLGFPSTDVDRHLAVRYDANNYNTTMKANFDAEVAQYKAHKAQRDAVRKAAGGPEVTLADLQYFVDQLQSAQVAARTTTGSPRAASPGRASRVRDLAKRLTDAAAKGKVLDVSKMDPVKKTGIKMINPVGASSKKYGVPGLALVSNNPQLYALAVRELGPEYEGYIAQYNTLVAQKNTVAVPAPAATLGALPAPPVASPTLGVPALPTVAASPLAGGVALPTIPGAGVLPTTSLPIGSPVGSPLGL